MPESQLIASDARRRRRRPKRETAEEGKSVWGEQYHLKAIGRALDVLECFEDDTTCLSLKELSKISKLPESSLFRILLTLENRGYLLQNADGSYRLPPKLLYGRLHERAETLRAVARPYLQKLAARFDETASLACLFGDQVRVLDTVETFQEIRMGNKPGRVLPPHCSSLGKAITAFQPPELVNRMLEVYGLFRRTERTIVERQVLLAEFDLIRQQGRAYDREETVMGGFCIGAPIAHPPGHVFAAISVSTPLVRMSPEREAEIIQALGETAELISSDLWKRPSGRAGRP
jgi:DNA-binding IclR family transcriptional regulator